jgi:hypothetical protein
MNLSVLSGKNMARPKLDPNDPHATPQVTLRGRSAYVLLELAKLRGGEADAARWIIDMWIGGEGRKILLEQYGIDVLAYKQASNVVPIKGRKAEH